MKINYIKEQELLDFEKEIGVELIVDERKKPSKGCRFYARFEKSEIKEGDCLRGAFGNGDTINEALMDYCKEISNGLLVLNSYTCNRREIQVPKLMHTKKDLCVNGLDRDHPILQEVYKVVADEILGLIDNSIRYGNPDEFMGYCEVKGCNEEAVSGGNCWRETGWWAICDKHSKIWRAKEIQPKMNQSAINRESKRGKDGILRNVDVKEL